MVKLYAINILEEIKEEQWEVLYKKISKERKEKLDKYKFYKDRKRSLLAEHLVFYGLKDQYNIEREQFKYYYNEYGKPMVFGREDIFFNLSHSGDWVVCAVGDNVLGIDVEIIGEVNEGVFEKVLTDKEKLIFSTSGEEKDAYFYKLWTLKESFVKALGVGMSLSFQNVDMIQQEEKIKVLLNGKEENSYAFVCKAFDDKHMLSVCVKTEDEVLILPPIRVLNMDNLMQ